MFDAAAILICTVISLYLFTSRFETGDTLFRDIVGKIRTFPCVGGLFNFRVQSYGSGTFLLVWELTSNGYELYIGVRSNSNSNALHMLEVKLSVQLSPIPFFRAILPTILIDSYCQ